MSKRVRPSRRHSLQKRAVKSLVETLTTLYPMLPVGEVEVVEGAYFEDMVMYIIDGKPAFFKHGDRLLPLLTLLLEKGYEWLPQIYVDRGAVKAMLRGADLMIPGVRGVKHDFNKGSVVVIVDEDSRAPITVGEALIDSMTLKNSLAQSGKGKVVRNLHHVGDRLWSLSTSIG